MSNPLLLFWYRLLATTEIVFVMVVRHTQGWILRGMARLAAATGRSAQLPESLRS